MVFTANVGGTSHFAVNTARVNIGLPMLLSGNGAFNDEALSGAKSLDTTGPHIQKLDPNGSNRNVDLVAETASVDGLWFWIHPSVPSSTAPTRR